MDDQETNNSSGNAQSETDHHTLYDWIFPNYSRATKRYILDAFCVVFAILTLIGFLNTDSWLLSLPANFLMQYLFVLSGVAIGYVWLNAYARLMVPLCLLPFLTVTIAPLYLSEAAGTSDQQVKSGETLTVMSVNVYTANKRVKAVRELITSKQPDVVLLMEINRHWIRNLEPLFADYPHRTLQPRSDNFGIGLISRIPVEDIDIERMSSHYVPVVFASLNHEGRTVRMAGLHTLPPVSPSYFHGRNELMSAVGDRMAMQNGPRFVIGDFNMTSWSSHFQLLTERAGLRDSRKGFGNQPTWPAFPFHPLHICVDHCLVSEEFMVRNRTRGPQIGSDHYPIIVDLALRQPED